MPSLAVSWAAHADEQCQRDAHALAARLQLPLLMPQDSDSDHDNDSPRASVAGGERLYRFVLSYDAEGLCLRQSGPGAPGPLRVCFEQGRQLWRLRHGGGRSQLIARALGLHKTARRPAVLDVTAGLGQDGFVLAGLGCEVTLLERSAIIAALLGDGLRRLGASADDDLRTLAGHLHLHCIDAMDYLRDAAPIDVVYLDPMFPEHGRAAGVRKEMKLFRELLPEEQDEQHSALLLAALAVARHRVVVKRMKKSPLIGGPAPSYQMSGKSVRYDIYALRKYD